MSHGVRRDVSAQVTELCSQEYDFATLTTFAARQVRQRRPNVVRLPPPELLRCDAGTWSASCDGCGAALRAQADLRPKGSACAATGGARRGDAHAAGAAPQMHIPPTSRYTRHRRGDLEHLRSIQNLLQEAGTAKGRLKACG